MSRFFKIVASLVAKPQGIEAGYITTLIIPNNTKIERKFHKRYWYVVALKRHLTGALFITSKQRKRIKRFIDSVTKLQRQYIRTLAQAYGADFYRANYNKSTGCIEIQLFKEDHPNGY